MGPFDEEEEGTGVASDVVKVKDEDPATPGSPDLRNDPGTVTIPQYRVNKTMQHTHTLWRGASTCVGADVICALACGLQSTGVRS